MCWRPWGAGRRWRKVFLKAAAIVDDLGAVVAIAPFYTATLDVTALVASLALVGVLAVLVTLTTPAVRRVDEVSFMEIASALLNQFLAGLTPGRAVPDVGQAAAVHGLDHACEAIEPPLERLERGLHGLVAFGIMPVFALANAGVALGLVVGKPTGVVGLAFLAAKLGLAALPASVAWRHVLGVSFLTGIGFTMSISIANLAFGSGELLDSAKVGILAASVVSGALGAVVLIGTPSRPPSGEPS